MAHQYMPKIFHVPHKKHLAPSYILNVRSLKLYTDIMCHKKVGISVSKTLIKRYPEIYLDHIK